IKRLEYIFIDKSDWDRGPWDSEPDKVQWQDAATGLPCLAVRNPVGGNWCGYVAVCESHPWFKKHYSDDGVEIRCHGGLTFSGFCQEDDKEHGICHVPGEGEPDRVWWFGFDCMHSGDLGAAWDAKQRELLRSPFFAQNTYRTLPYVREECAQIAQQLSRIH